MPLFFWGKKSRADPLSPPASSAMKRVSTAGPDDQRAGALLLKRQVEGAGLVQLRKKASSGETLLRPPSKGSLL